MKINLCMSPVPLWRAEIGLEFGLVWLGADNSVWDEITARVTALKMAWIFEPQDVKDALTAFTRELTATKAKQLGWTFAEDDDHIQRQFKSVSPRTITLLMKVYVCHCWIER